MDYSKKNPSSDSHVGIPNPIPSDFQRRMGFWKEVAEETNENEGHSHRGFAEPKKKFMSTVISATSKMKILAERNNDELPLPDSSNTHFETILQVKPMVGSDHIESPSQTTPLSPRVCSYGDQKTFSSDSSCSVPYDPVTNYTSPRPEFLRYNPDRRKEILQRIEGEMRNEEQGSGIDSGSSPDLEEPTGKESSSVSSASSKSSFQDEEIQKAEEDDSDVEVDDTEEEEVKHWYSRMVWKLLFLFGVLLFSSHYFSSMSSSPPPFQDYGGSGENLPRRISDRKLFSGNFLMGLSNMCLNVGELTCGFEGICSNLILSDDSFKREDSEEKDSHDEITKVNLGDSPYGNDGINRNWLMAYEVTGMVDAEENESQGGIKLATERDEDMFVVDGILSGDDLVAEGKSKEPVGSHEFLAEELYSEREGSGKEEIFGPETMETCNVPYLIGESVQASQTQFVSDDSPTHQDAELNPLSCFETETNSREAAQGEESAELSESLLVPQSQFVSSLLSDDQNAEESDFLTISETALQRKHGSVFVWKVQLYLLISSLMVILGISSGLFFKYFAKSCVSSLLVSPPSPNLLPCSESVHEKRISPAGPVMEDLGDKQDKHEDLNTNPKPLNCSIDERKEFYATRPPTVELLGEFSLVEATISEIGSGQKLMRRGFEEESQLSQSQRRRGPEESQLSQSQRRPIRKNLSSSANKVHPHPSLESTSNGSYTAEKLLRKEDIGGRGEVKKVAATPVRRSSRLQNRVTSP